MGNKLKILIVDDSMIIRKAIESNLTEYNMEIVGTAGDGAEAINLFKKTDPDIVTLDISMPEVDGLEVLKKILMLKPETKIIIITGNSDQVTGIQCMTMGAKDFIAKPFTPEDLKKSFSKFLEKTDP
jgi:two-component system chemotaxis response regulator CheY